MAPSAKMPSRFEKREKNNIIITPAAAVESDSHPTIVMNHL